MLHPDPGKEPAEIHRVRARAKRSRPSSSEYRLLFSQGATIGAHELRLARKRDCDFLRFLTSANRRKYINQFAASSLLLRRSWQGACPGGQDRRIDIAAVRPRASEQGDCAPTAAPANCTSRPRRRGLIGVNKICRRREANKDAGATVRAEKPQEPCKYPAPPDATADWRLPAMPSGHPEVSNSSQEVREKAACARGGGMPGRHLKRPDYRRVDRMRRMSYDRPCG